MITSKQLRNKWISFYESKGHVNIGAVSLIGDGSTGVMFNVAGMQPLFWDNLTPRASACATCRAA